MPERLYRHDLAQSDMGKVTPQERMSSEKSLLTEP
jgi:hypothetical protein